MNPGSTILLTGAAGFIGSYLLGYLNKKGYGNIIIVDDFSEEDKWFNFDSKQFTGKVEREELFDWLKNPDTRIDFVFHLGARTDTAEFDYAVHEKLNVEYSKKIWNYCSEKNIPLVYASSAATYGSGELGYKDDHDIAEKLQPLNPYGVSKNEFDKWAIRKSRESGAGSSDAAKLVGVLTGASASGVGAQRPAESRESAPPFWAGLKFFNVYGPNEYHKGRMASMIFHGFNQIRATGKVKLFRSHKTGFKNGQQLRDFIFVEDVAKVCYWFMEKSGVGSRKTETGHLSSDNGHRSSNNGHRSPVTGHQSTDIRLLTPGLYNLGTGKARTFEDLAKATFEGLGKPPVIEYIDMPEDIRDKYQYFTEADMTKLKTAGYNENFRSLEEGVGEYVKNFLARKAYY